VGAGRGTGFTLQPPRRVQVEGQRDSRRGNYDEKVRPCRADDRIGGVGGRAATDHHVGLVGREHCPRALAGADFQAQVNRRVRGYERGERRRQQVLARRRDRRDADQAAARVTTGAGRGEGLLVQAEDAARVRRVRVTGRRQAQAPAVPLDEGGLDFARKGSEGCRDGRLGDREPTRRLAHRSRVGDCYEGTKPGNGRHVSPP